MKRAFPRLLAAALLLFGGMLAEPPQALARTKARQALVAPALWEVKDADTTVYLFGTVHVLKPGVDWFKGGIRRAFDQSDELVLEIIEPEDPREMASIMGGAAVARDGTALSQRLEPSARQKYQAAMAANSLPWQAFEMFNPWMAGLALSVAPLEKLGYKADEGVEKGLSAAARAAGKKIGALETPEQQIGYFAALPMTQQVAFLNATVDGLDDMEAQFASLVRHWQDGEPEKLAEEMNASLEATPELADILLFQRNARWAEWIKARMAQPGTVFIAVGAGHLAGRNSVQDQLKALGIATARVGK
ncbi:TraB/GumN family protein [Sphingobium cloacae]|uniref:Polysaccharide biosynthesis protein GumN n=1 Tax=Sphingobium cloacae TaxID=120107 RepID=A0A1E1EYH1_9SPHN|nr:TraB/GumN family protein [Sphingobium cloacae]BAV63281.1 polysaccharide biosynthesis protein GumN [Sphingobium cloacae]